MRNAVFLIAITLATSAFAAPVDDAAAIAIARPQELIVDNSLPKSTIAAMRNPVDAFYGFWNNGSPALLDAAISTGFTDRTLPKGRPQGRAGPIAASKAMLTAVPDLKVSVVKMLIVGDRVVAHLQLSGHFTGTFMGATGTGQTVDFIATDILRVTDGKITDNWHLEDNLSFLQQLGLAE